jgi:tripartite-type tricarboxylate transporter receptor subunit TctC
MFRRSLISRIILSALATSPLIASGPLLAQDKPVIHVLVGFPPGVGTDNLARMYAEALGEALNATTVVENKPGAGGQLAAQALKQATPQSNSLMFAVDHQVVMLPARHKEPGFDVKTDMVRSRASSTSSPASRCRQRRR